ncbi:MAG: pitrilysin family protein [Candidatus Paceibacterota bacterium]|jgi:predicted Zn-dependent peptidase
MYKKSLLSGGSKLITVPLEHTNTVTILLLVRTGSKNESENIRGISHFLEHMFFKGTAKRPTTLDISKELDRVGGVYNAFTGKEYTGFWVKVDASNFDLAADVISDIVLNSKFDQSEINKERGTIIEEMNMYLDNPMMYVPTLYESVLYKDQPLGFDEIGNRETINSVKREDFVKYYNDYYSADNIVIAVCGKINEKQVESKIGKYFMGISDRRSPDQASAHDDQSQPNLLVNNRKTDQTHICIGVRAYGIESENKYAMSILSAILGGNMSSRLFTSVREKNGLAYYIHTSAESYKDVGYLVTQAGLSNEKSIKAIKIILDEYKRIRDFGVDADELSKAKTYLKGRTTIALESSDSMASFVAMQELYSGKILTPEEKFDKIDSVSAKDIKRVSEDIFVDKKLNLALIGPFEDNAPINGILSLK